MRLTNDQLTIKALRALEEASHSCQTAPLPPSLGLRFVLAFLYCQGHGRREPFDHFWRNVTMPGREGQNAHAAGIARSQVVNASLNGIYHELGIERTPEMMSIGFGIRHGK
jgi:hypothetical protein